MSGAFGKLILAVALSAICFCLAIATRGQTFSKGLPRRVEVKITNRIFALPEVKARMRYVDSASGGTRHLAVVLYDQPTKERKYYWVKVWEDNGGNYVSHFNFFVAPGTLDVKYLDTQTDSLLDLTTWRCRKH